ncbi:MAG: PEGA domain-containing protein [Phycisphaerales bacterium]|jgi:hypothetical protein|nr:PEGA domain-containing protein [Phycisphaerales bacterium]
MSHLHRVASANVVRALSGASLLAACAATLVATGCSRRTIEVTSEPSGALVWINDQQVGRTPLEADFKYFGTYDVRVVLDGYEPITAGMKAEAPLHEQPGIDLLAAPATLTTTVRWHFDLAPSAETTLGRRAAEELVITRARAFREAEVPTPAPASAPASPSSTPAPSATPSR